MVCFSWVIRKQFAWVLVGHNMWSNCKHPLQLFFNYWRKNTLYSRPILHSTVKCWPLLQKLCKALFWCKTLRKGIDEGCVWNFGVCFFKLIKKCDSGKCPFMEMSFGELSVGQMSIGQMSLGNCLSGNCPRTVLPHDYVNCLYYEIAKNVHAIAEIKAIFHLLAVAWKRTLFRELMLSSKMKHTYIMTYLMESSSIGITITQIWFGIKIMKTKLNSQNMFGSYNVMGLSWI